MMLSGCATTANAPANDPHEGFNRKVFAFNMSLDKAVLLPVAKFYSRAVPGPARTGVHNALSNLDEPVVFSNQLLQGHLTDAGKTVVRFAVNSSVGIAGLVDVGTKLDLPPQDTDFGITLGVWGAGEGPYLMLPLLGPAPPRDLSGMAVDNFLDPVTYLDFRSKLAYVGGRDALQILDMRSRNIETLDAIERTSIDFYAVTRSLYLQHRDAQIRGDEPPPDDGL